MADGITLTCKMGKFTFDKGVSLSTAKLIRDSVMAQYFSPKGDMLKIKGPQDAHALVKNTFGSDWADIPFTVVIAPQE